jgi:hypothetical protein
VHDLVLCAESITINPVTSTTESAHGVSWCVMVCRGKSADVRFWVVAPPFFRSLFADFRRFSILLLVCTILKNKYYFNFIEKSILK